VRLLIKEARLPAGKKGNEPEQGGDPGFLANTVLQVQVGFRQRRNFIFPFSK